MPVSFVIVHGIEIKLKKKLSELGEQEITANTSNTERNLSQHLLIIH